MGELENCGRYPSRELSGRIFFVVAEAERRSHFNRKIELAVLVGLLRQSHVPLGELEPFGGDGPVLREAGHRTEFGSTLSIELCTDHCGAVLAPNVSFDNASNSTARTLVPRALVCSLLLPEYLVDDIGESHRAKRADTNNL